MEKLEDKKISIKAVITTIVAVSMSLFHLYTSEFGLLSAVVQRSIHLLFALLITFLTLSFIKTPKKKGKLKNFFTILDIIFMIFSCITLIYLIVGYKELILRGGAATTTDLIFGSILIILVLESTRRVLGLALPLITVIAILYAFFGDYLPGAWGHRALDLEQFITYQYLTTEGLFTIPLGVSASYIIIFIIFGAFLLNSGVGEFFIAFANSIAGSMRGGPAKVAVLSSATMGTISGSAVANVVSTGSFTIPLMKKIGYTPLFAGAVESVASTGGQFMPPIMGAAAFIIAEMLGIPYIKVCLAAAIPAILYFFSLFYMVHIEAIKQGLKGIPKNQLPSFKREVFSRGHLILPAIILVVLMVYGYSPMKAGFWAVISVVLISMVKKETRMDFKKIIKSLENGAKGSLQVVTACACAGIVIGVVTQTGLGLKFSTLVISAAKGYLFLSLIYVMLTSLILGMGLTTSAAYILTVIIGGPVLINLGVKPIAAHLFVFYYACLSAITPPVALAAFAGAGISGAPPFKTGFTAMRLALIAYIVPFIIVYNPVLLFHGNILNIIFSFITAIIGCIAIGSSLEGYFLLPLSILEKIFFFLAGFALLKPGAKSDFVGFGMLIFILVTQIIKKRIAKKVKITKKLSQF
ncbi:MAG: hypothetical protein DRG20_06665 [Deltaproteobacteria bacterium]|nr:TRAP transporter permease [Deltaproteobacteria bacterium]RLA88068.1 MAG: hypothetical protein DRG20_06665 [Deltaproteobacteria bacterium]